ncbi:MAG: helix-turn-helix domain-containing protein [Hyphomicrobiales bacterium]
MSVQFLAWAFKVEGLSPAQKVLLLALADNADDDGKCWPSKATLMIKTGLKSKKTISANMTFLTDNGLVSIESRQRKNGSNASNIYILNYGVKITLGAEKPHDGGFNTPTPSPLKTPPYEPPSEPSLEPSIKKTNKKENQLSIAKPKQELAQNPDFESFNLALDQYSELAKKYGLRIPRVVSAKNEVKARKTIKALENMGSNWVEYLRIIARSPHLLGKNDRNWKASFDWIINPTNFEKIVNGNYEQDRPNEKPTEAEKWGRRLSGLREKDLWVDSWGSKPGESGCQVPPQILQQYGFSQEMLT